MHVSLMAPLEAALGTPQAWRVREIVPASATSPATFEAATERVRPQADCNGDGAGEGEAEGKLEQEFVGHAGMSIQRPGDQPGRQALLPAARSRRVSPGYIQTPRRGLVQRAGKMPTPLTIRPHPGPPPQAEERGECLANTHSHLISTASSPSPGQRSTKPPLSVDSYTIAEPAVGAQLSAGG